MPLHGAHLYFFSIEIVPVHQLVRKADAHDRTDQRMALTMAAVNVGECFAADRFS